MKLFIFYSYRTKNYEKIGILDIFLKSYTIVVQF